MPNPYLTDLSNQAAFANRGAHYSTRVSKDVGEFVGDRSFSRLLSIPILKAVSDITEKSTRAIGRNVGVERKYGRTDESSVFSPGMQTAGYAMQRGLLGFRLRSKNASAKWIGSDISTIATLMDNEQQISYERRREDLKREKKRFKWWGKTLKTIEKQLRKISGDEKKGPGFLRKAGRFGLGLGAGALGLSALGVSAPMLLAGLGGIGLLGGTKGLGAVLGGAGKLAGGLGTALDLTGVGAVKGTKKAVGMTRSGISKFKQAKEYVNDNVVPIRPGIMQDEAAAVSLESMETGINKLVGIVSDWKGFSKKEARLSKLDKKKDNKGLMDSILGLGGTILGGFTTLKTALAGLGTLLGDKLKDLLDVGGNLTKKGGKTLSKLGSKTKKGAKGLFSKLSGLGKGALASAGIVTASTAVAAGSVYKAYEKSNVALDSAALGRDMLRLANSGLLTDEEYEFLQKTAYELEQKEASSFLGFGGVTAEDVKAVRSHPVFEKLKLLPSLQKGSKFGKTAGKAISNIAKQGVATTAITSGISAFKNFKQSDAGKAIAERFTTGDANLKTTQESQSQKQIEATKEMTKVVKEQSTKKEQPIINVNNQGRKTTKDGNFSPDDSGLWGNILNLF